MIEESGLHHAIREHDLAAIKLILRNGTGELESEAETSARYLLRPIHYAVEYSGAETALVIEWLAQAGADLDAKSRHATNLNPENHNITALYQAADCNHIAAALALFDGGANPNIFCRGWTPLHRAAQHDHPLMVELLVTNDADLSAKNPINGMTALHSAAYSGAVRACSRLWLLGADLNAKNANGQTPLEVAIESRKPATIDFLGRLTTAANIGSTTPIDWGYELLEAIKVGSETT